jgi:hypothetical protein
MSTSTAPAAGTAPAWSYGTTRSYRPSPVTNGRWPGDVSPRTGTPRWASRWASPMAALLDALVTITLSAA